MDNTTEYITTAAGTRIDFSLLILQSADLPTNHEPDWGFVQVHFHQVGAWLWLQQLADKPNGVVLDLHRRQFDLDPQAVTDVCALSRCMLDEGA